MPLQDCLVLYDVRPGVLGRRGGCRQDKLMMEELTMDFCSSFQGNF